MKIKTILLLALTISLNANDLKQTISELMTTNPIILERLHNYKATQQNISKAQAGYYPTLDLTLAYGTQKTDTALKKTQLSVYQNSLKYTHNLFNGFETTYTSKAEKYRTVAAAYSYIEKVNSTAFNMTDSYLQIMKNKELLENEQVNIDINEEIAIKVHKLYDAGLTTLSEVNKIESSLALARANLIVQKNTILNENYRFKRLLGRNIDVLQMLKPTINFTLPTTQTKAIEFSLNNNPSLLVSQFNIKQLQARNTKEKARFYPKLDVEVSQTMSKNLSAIEGERTSFQAMAYLSYNIFNGFSDSASLKQSFANIEQEIQKNNTLQRSVTEELSLAWASKTTLKEQLKYLKEYRDYAHTTLDLYSKEYDLGRRSLLDLLSAQNDFIKAKAQIITAQYNLLYAKYRILNAMGVLVSSVLGDTSALYSNVNISQKR